MSTIISITLIIIINNRIIIITNQMALIKSNIILKKGILQINPIINFIKLIIIMILAYIIKLNN
jgi:hypothetical protein